MSLRALDLRGLYVGLHSFLFMVDKSTFWGEARKIFSVFNWFKADLKLVRVNLTLAVISYLSLQILQIVLLYKIGEAVDVGLTGKDWHKFSRLLIQIVSLAFAEFLLSFWRSLLSGRVGEEAGTELRVKIFKHICEIPPAEASAFSIGDLSSRIDDQNQVRGYYTRIVTTLLPNCVFLIVFIYLSVRTSPQLSIVILLPILSHVLNVIYVQTKSSKNRKDIAETRSLLRSHLIETIACITFVACSDKFSVFVSNWRVLSHRFHSLVARRQAVDSFSDSFRAFIRRMTTIGSAVIGCYLVSTHQVTVGIVISFSLLADRAGSYLNAVATAFADAHGVAVSADRLSQVINIPGEKLDSCCERQVDLVGQVDLRNVSFCYPQTASCLREVSLSIRAGERVGLIGPSGSGKSTLAKIIQGIHRPTSGVVCIGNLNIWEHSPRPYRHNVSLVQQDAIVFEGTITDNIAMGDPAFELNELIECCKIAQIHEFIESLPQGYNTNIQERGKQLSGGQKQRIALARALYAKSSVVVLDEVTSGLDFEAENLIAESLQCFPSDRTLIIISHRPGILKAASKFFVLQNGEISGVGTQQELVRSNNYFSEFCFKTSFTFDCD